MTNPLHRQGARGGVITVVGQAGRMVVQLTSVVVLSRLLSPEEFGLIAMVAVFMTLADLIRDFGLSGAALQAKVLSHQQASNLFWASSALGAAAAVVLAALSPLLVALYDEPRLAHIVPALAITLFFSGAHAQVQVQLARQLKFPKLALCAFLAPAAGLALAIAAAVAGWGYWALVIQPVSTALTLLISQSVGAQWVPTWPRRGHQSLALFRSGSQLGAAHFLTWAANSIDSLVIGGRWGATSLGYYDRSFQLTATMVGGIMSPLTQVALPILNEFARQGRKPAELLLRMQFLVAGPINVLMLILALTAPSLIPLALGDGWERAIPLVQILALAECFHALSFISYWGFLAERLSKQLLYYNMVTKPLGVVLIIVSSFWGLEAIAFAYVAGLAVSWPINLAWLSRTASFNGWQFFRHGLRLLMTTAIAYVTLSIAFRAFLATVSWTAVIVSALSAVAVFGALSGATHAGRRDLKLAAIMVKNLR